MSDYQASEQVSLEKPKSPDGPGKPGSGKTPAIIIVLLVVIGALAFYFINKKAGDEAKGSFGVVMDAMAGQGNWSAESLSYSLFSKTLTAGNLIVDLKPKIETLVNPLKISSVVIKNGLRRSELDSLTATPDWRNQPDTPLAESVAIKGASLDIPDGPSIVALKAGELRLIGLSLAAAGADNDAGSLGYAKSARLARFVNQGMSITMSGSDNSKLNLTLDSSEGSDLRFSPELADIASLYDATTLLTVGQVQTKGLAITYTDPDGTQSVKATMGEHEASNFAALSYDSLRYKNVAFNARLSLNPERDEVSNISMSLEEVGFTDIDFKPLVEKFFRTVDFSASPEEVERGLSRFTTMADLFTLPYSLGSAEVKDFRVAIGTDLVSDAFKIGVDVAAYKGPSIAGKIAPSQTWSVSGLKIDLPAQETGNPDYDKAFAFGRDFGQSSFVGGIEAKASYEPETGTLTFNSAPAIGIADLGVLNFDLGIVGLTPELVKDMEAIPMIESENLLFAPGFSELGVSRLRLEFADNSLADKILGYFAKKSGSDLEVTRTSAAVTAAFVIGMADTRLANSQELGQLASEFIRAPGRIVIEMIPNEPLSLTSILKSASQSELLNSLNVSVTINENDPLIPAFLDPPPEAESEGIDEGDDPNDIENVEDLDDMSMSPEALPEDGVSALQAQ